MIIDIKIEPLTSDDAGGFSVVDLKTFLLYNARGVCWKEVIKVGQRFFRQTVRF